MNLRKEDLQHTDIYLIDQLLKGNLDQVRTVLDAGCGAGRNLPCFLHNDIEVYGIDPSEKAIAKVRALDGAKADHFQVATVEHIPFHQPFDLIICNAVLHFARDQHHFNEMLASLWNALAPGGILFTRLASDIGLEDRVTDLGDGQFALPDGTTRYLVNQAQLLRYTEQLGATLVEPIKTTNVQYLRCMTTWILKKPLIV